MVDSYNILSDAQREMVLCSCENYDKILDESNDLRSDNSRLESKYEKIRIDIEREKLSNVRDNTRIQGQLDVANSNVTNLTKQLEDTKKELKLVCVEKEKELVIMGNKLDQRRDELEVLRLDHEREKVVEEIEKNSLKDLIREKESVLRGVSDELGKKYQEIRDLQNQKGQSQGDLLNERLRSERSNLELFSTQLEIGLEQIDNLVRYHERLFQARKDSNQVNVITHQDNISRVKQELLLRRINIVNIQEICRKCERITELNWELEQIQEQRYEN
jgi:hypothetical protein